MPDTSTNEQKITNSLISIVIESWRFSKLFERVISKLDAGDQSRFVSQYQWYVKKLNDSLNEADLKIVNLEGQSYEVGAAATALNIDDFDSDDLLEVEKMLEPIIMGPDGLLHHGTVTLRKV